MQYRDVDNCDMFFMAAVRRLSPFSSLIGWEINSLNTRDLARNEEFSEIAVINIFLVLKKNTSYLWGGVLRVKFRDKSHN